MSRYRVKMQFDLTIGDEAALQQLAHRVMTEQIERSKSADGVEVVSDFVDTGQQAADYVAQDMNHAVQLAALEILQRGGPVPGVTGLSHVVMKRPERLGD
jgi:hypothetical protein